MEAVSVYAGLVFFSILYSPIELVLSVLMNAMSRKHEYEADAFAARDDRYGRTSNFGAEAFVGRQPWQSHPSRPDCVSILQPPTRASTNCCIETTIGWGLICAGALQ